MKRIFNEILCIALLLCISYAAKGQNFEVGGSVGFNSMAIDTGAFDNGLYGEGNLYMYDTQEGLNYWVARVGVAYASIYQIAEAQKYHYANFFGGVGFRDVNGLLSWTFEGGYMKHIKPKGIGSVFVQTNATIWPIRYEKWKLFISGTVGSTFSPIYESKDRGSVFFRGSLGVSYLFSGTVINKKAEARRARKLEQPGY